MIVILPLMIPAIMLGLSLLTMYRQLNISRGLGTVILGYSTFTTSFVTLVVSASLYNFDITLEEAARDLYAGPVRTFFKVTLPGIFPGVMSGALFAFSLSFDEYIIAFLNIGTKQTIPLVIMAMMRFGLSPKINALATLIYFVSFMMAVTAGLLVVRKGGKRII
jgi:spermidine/putrescine transport system permease protein